jgi:hypothetical protein
MFGAARGSVGVVVGVATTRSPADREPSTLDSWRSLKAIGEPEESRFPEGC